MHRLTFTGLAAIALFVLAASPAAADVGDIVGPLEEELCPTDIVNERLGQTDMGPCVQSGFVDPDDCVCAMTRCNG